MSAVANDRAAASLAGALAGGGVRDLVLSPGSRSTPLVLAFARAPGVRVHVVLDERVAGFVALGLARAGGRPVATLATSGSAGAHYLPAAIEAGHSGLPLVFLTADRPPELHGVGAPQTIDQRHLLGRHVRWFGELAPPPHPPGAEGWPARLAAQALAAALGPPAGPVHLNVAFREPLWSPEVAPAPIEVARPPRVLRSAAAPDPALVAEVDRRLRGRRGVVVCGPRAGGSPQASPRFAAAATTLARRLGWPLLADPLSGVRLGPHARDGVVAAYDALLRDPAFARRHAPEVVLRFGQLPASRPLSEWLARVAAETVLVDEGGAWLDPTHQARTLVAAEPAALARALADAGPCPAPPGWRDAWRRAEAAAQAALAQATADGTWGGSVARALVASLPDGALLHAASSLPVRDLEGFVPPLARDVRVTSNRGANGIDGTLATLWGQALAWDGPAFALVGDLAFLHDAGGLLAARGLGARATVVVVDNGGGGIFDHLPIAEHPTAHAPYFLTPQTASIGGLCRAAQVEHLAARDLGDLRRALAREADGPRVIEVAVDRAFDLRRHRQAWSAVSEALEEQPRPEEAPCPTS